MQLVIVQACGDKYSHTPLSTQYQRMEGDYSIGDLQATVNHAKEMFAGKRWSAMKLMHIDVNLENNQVTVIENLDLKHPLKTKTIINKEALAAREARKTTKRYTDDYDLSWTTATVTGSFSATNPVISND